MRYHFTPVRMAIISKSTNKCCPGCGERGNLCTVGGNSHFGKQKSKNGSAF